MAGEQMFDHALEYLKGWPMGEPLDFDAKASADVVGSIYAGKVVHVNASGEFELGAKGFQMPIFLHQNSDDHDVANDGGGRWYAIAPTGKMSGVVATGGYELETSEFLTSATYAPNDKLKSPTEDQVTGGSEDDAGKLYKTKAWTGGGGGALTLYTDTICGCVSRAKYVNQHGVSMLPFWPVFLPGSA